MSKPAKGHILVVEDNAQVRSLAADFLREEGFDVTEAQTGEDALRLLDSPEGFDVVFTDVRMPGSTDGIALATQVRQLHPDTPILIATGYPAQLDRQTSALGPPTAFLEKPYSLIEMGEIVNRLSGH